MVLTLIVVLQGVNSWSILMVESLITVEELSELAGTFNYEFVCCLGKRIPRIYLTGGRIAGVKDYFRDLYPEPAL